MNSALEFHDSRVSSITSDGTHLSMRFKAAYLHKSEGVPGVDEGTGWVQEGQLVFSNAKWQGSFEIGDGWLVDGQLTAGSEDPRSMVPVPFAATDGVFAEFSFSNGCALEVKAEAVRLTLFGEAQYVEAFHKA